MLALLLSLVLSAPLVATSAAAEPRPDSYVLPGTNVFPEGITARGRTFYVTSTATGAVFRGDVKDQQVQTFLPGGQDGRTTAIGLEVSPDGDRLVVAGGATGLVFVYDTSSGELVARFSNGLTGREQTFLNDVAFDRAGNAYVTDSVNDVLYRIPAAQVERGASGTQSLPVFVDFTGTAFGYVAGFNANGIAVTPDGRYAVVIQSNTGELFRIDLTTRRVQQVDVGGADLTAGDGIELRGRTLYVVRNRLEQIAEVRLSGDLLRGRLVDATTYREETAFPTTAAFAAGRLLVVNSQFDQRDAQGRPTNPTNPFTVSSLKP